MEWTFERVAGPFSLTEGPTFDTTKPNGLILAPDCGALAATQVFPGWRGQPAAPHDLTPEAIGELLAQYRRAAEICAVAGYRHTPQI